MIIRDLKKQHQITCRPKGGDAEMKTLKARPGFLNLGTTDILVQICVVKGCPGHRRLWLDPWLLSTRCR